jgi:hypothetical protein
MDTKLFEKFAVLDAQKSSLETRIKAIKDEMKQIEEAIIEQSLEEGIEKMTVIVGHTDDGLPVKRTVYRQRQLWAGHNGDPDALNEALKEAGLHEYLQEKVNTNSLSAYVRGFDPDRNKSPEQIMAELPYPLKQVLKVSEVLKIKSITA